MDQRPDGVRQPVGDAGDDAAAVVVPHQHGAVGILRQDDGLGEVGQEGLLRDGRAC